MDLIMIQIKNIYYKGWYPDYTVFIYGINITDKTFRHIEAICAKATKFFKSPIFEKETFSSESNTWNLKMIKKEGLPSAELEYGVTDDFIAPDFVVELVYLVMDLASFDNKGFRYF